jgi:hypothetical protein
MKRRRIALFFLLVGGIMVAAPMSMAVAQTAPEEAATLGFFEVNADAAGVGVAFGNPAAPPYPTAAGLVPNATADFSGGPAGRAVSSIAWPGPLAANAGTLAGLVGVPLPPDVLANANYPVKAEAAASGGNRDEQSLGPMTSIVDENQALSRTAMTDFAAGSVVSAARVVTKSRSYLEGSTTGAVAETILQGVEIGGQVKIDTVKTIATAITDGTTATLDHEVVVSGVTVGGQGATIDQEGMKIGPSTNPNPAGEVVKGFNEGFASGGMQAFLTEPSENQSTGGAGSISSGALVFIWKMGDSGQQFVVTLGGATARVQATPGTALDLGTDALGSIGGGDTGSADFGSLSSPVDLGSTASFGSPTTGGGSGGGGRSAVVPADDILGFEPVSAISDRVPMGWMLIGILGMFFLGMGLQGLRETALTGALGTACPLERGVM